MDEIITINEVQNDGMTIHLYCNDMCKLYVAYGISAFLLSRIGGFSPSYSVEMQMPEVVIDEARFEQLKCQLQEIEALPNYCRFRVERSIDEAEYIKWASGLRRYKM